MEIGIGIPNTIRGATGPQLMDWAKRADAAGFHSLATIGAVSYPGYEELTLLAAAAAVTERIRLFPNVLISPARSTAELAKQAATVDQISGGRLTLGLGVGWRQADFDLTGRSFSDRGRRFDQMLADLKRAWAGEALADGTRPVCPPPVQQGGIPILVGGMAPSSYRRVAAHGVGWTAGGLPPDVLSEASEQVRIAWREAGRDGSPRIAALFYFGLGDTEEESRDNIYHYYEPAGAEMAGMVADSVARTPEVIRGAISAFEAAGVDELILDPSVADPDQVDMVAEVVFGGS